MIRLCGETQTCLPDFECSCRPISLAAPVALLLVPATCLILDQVTCAPPPVAQDASTHVAVRLQAERIGPAGTIAPLPACPRSPTHILSRIALTLYHFHCLSSSSAFAPRSWRASSVARETPVSIGTKPAVDQRFISGLSAVHQRDEKRSSFVDAD
jgi:hypothetical protein